ncbi:MAG: two-component sensor histidine kinase [Actinobacteria bacterium]|nr:two-component sensor histidine kinase [Actinomycetota bacterium]NCU80436.1 two-component sensor histidine kinase [Acidimicrobiia bacterium]NDC99368.1 two-component sensor histidine kinase [bacterium]HBQ52790.1 two-component sensor histidine kinase [Acidimicrobium sp.]NBO97418.1 two-component sensor histidine kinase [Actinomycetota bacterium]
MDLIFFLSGAVATAFVAFFLSKRSSKELSVAIQNEAQANTTNTEDQLESLMDALDLLPIGVVIVDAKFNRRLRNNAAAAMTGVRYVDILVDQAVDEMLEQIKTTKSGERVLEAVAGTTRFFKIRGQEMDHQRAIVTIEDITEKSRIDTVQTDFVANLSHELKTPIGAVAALADSLNGETETEVVWRLAERIVTESHRMSRIVDDLLDLSRVEFGGTDEWTEIDLGPVLVEVVSTNQHSAKRQGLGLSLTGSAELMVRGDRSHLVSVFSNLVDNAIKYSEAGGIVLVESMIQGDEIVVNVTDHGIGIAERDQKRIFERFYRVDKARSRATGGTGLGLSIVRHIVLEHGGSIDVRSEEGIGSTFMVRLPRVTKQPKESIVEQTGVMA